MKLALADLVEGISWWLQKTKWPRDFHNEVYHNLYDLKKSGLSDSWWDRTVDRLQEWHATRPLTVDEIKKRGFEVLPRLQEMYLDLCAKSQDEPFFLDFRWERITGFYSLLAGIKGVGSPVFPSKLGHFIFPKLFIVMDNKATGVNDYQVFWQSMCEAWSNFSEKTKAKEILLEEINKYSTRKVHERYPFEIKIIELCTIGKRKTLTDQHKIDSDTFEYSEENSKVQRREVVMERLDEKFSCEHCRFSVTELKEMAEKGGKKEMFTTFGGRNWMNMWSEPHRWHKI